MDTTVATGMRKVANTVHAPAAVGINGDARECHRLIGSGNGPTSFLVQVHSAQSHRSRTRL